MRHLRKLYLNVYIVNNPILQRNMYDFICWNLNRTQKHPWMIIAKSVQISMVAQVISGLMMNLFVVMGHHLNGINSKFVQPVMDTYDFLHILFYFIISHIYSINVYSSRISLLSLLLYQKTNFPLFYFFICI